ncbi:MAG: 30S ribosomal protein S3, partial [Deltaproteobacteria bacterium]|nr:30S ribosomal protein S3 [Deltaproteobacteria bacterium]
MGQKVHPIGLRLGIIRSWDSTWFAKKEYANLVYEDAEIRKFLKEKLYHAGISRIEIARAADRARIRIHTARPGIVIGKKGAEIEALKRQLEQIV